MRTILYGLAIALLAMIVGRAEAKPNIILVIADDMETGLVRHMPVVRRELVNAGTTLTRAFFNNPLCCPSRATMLTGKYGQNTKVVTNSHEQFYKAGNDTRTLPVWLKQQGYRNGLVGKYLNDYPLPLNHGYIPPGWTEWFAKSRDGGNYYNNSVSDNGLKVRYGTTEADYSTDVYRRRAVQFVKDAMAAEEPFFLWLSFAAPHSPHTPAMRHKGAFSGLQAPRGPNFNEADVSDKPAHVRSRGRFSASFVAGLDEQYRNRARSLLSVDEAVGELLAALRKGGQLDNTYVVFVADNGFHHGQHRLARTKGLPYEEGLRMVFVIRGPGVRAGASHDYLVSNADIAPTFAEWAGASVPSTVDGRSFAAKLRDPSSGGTWRTAVPVSHSADGDKWPTWRGVRTRTELYVEYPATKEVEYYNTTNDPWQLQNRASSLTSAERTRLANLTARLNACTGADCRRIENGATAN